jgi:hypothetical protein
MSPTALEKLPAKFRPTSRKSINLFEFNEISQVGDLSGCCGQRNFVRTDIETRQYTIKNFVAKNKIQFQKGMSLDSFIQEFGTENKCRSFLSAIA